jgi:hypothetical protein
MRCIHEVVDVPCRHVMTLRIGYYGEDQFSVSFPSCGLWHELHGEQTNSRPVRWCQSPGDRHSAGVSHFDRTPFPALSALDEICCVCEAMQG